MNRAPKSFLEFNDAGAQDDEPVKGVTVGDIRAWHDEQELHSAHYDRILASWAECRELLSKERAITAALVGALRGIEKYSKDIAMVNAAHAAIGDALVAVAEPRGCSHWPGQKRCEVCGMGTTPFLRIRKTPYDA